MSPPDLQLIQTIIDEEKALEGHPRRLLHIPTLTSYKWEPGHIYNGIRNPRYIAFSYTWGRFELDEEEEDAHDVEALKIQGIDWQIPKIKRGHFEAAAFEHGIRKTAEPAPELVPNSPLLADQIDFAWLDVACIDQRRSELRSAAEIGRQADIFKRAHRVYAWLTTQKHEDGARRIDSFYKFLGSGSFCPDPLASIADMDAFLSDPWYSSLWTVQEAFLRPDAVFLSKDGRIFTRINGFTNQRNVCLRLKDINELGSDWQRRGEEKADDISLKAMIVVQKRGIDATNFRNPITTYTTAQKRTARDEEDRIYGIQQVFGAEYRFGKTALGQNLGQDCSLSVLEEQLGERLMSDSPVLSQFHLFANHVAPEKRWHLNTCSRDVRWLSPHVSVQAQCKFWVDHSSSFPKPVYFAGKVTPLADMFRAISDIVLQMFTIQDGDETIFADHISVYDIFQIYLDAAGELSNSPVPHGSLNCPWYQRREATDWLCENFPREALQILLMSEDNAGTPWSRVHGLVLLKCGPESTLAWTRIGICQLDMMRLNRWNDNMETFRQENPYFFGEERWVEACSTFGRLDNY